MALALALMWSWCPYPPGCRSWPGCCRAGASESSAGAAASLSRSPLAWSWRCPLLPGSRCCRAGSSTRCHPASIVRCCRAGASGPQSCRPRRCHPTRSHPASMGRRSSRRCNGYPGRDHSPRHATRPARADRAS
eukprot:scaffold90065_cov60-Phaeocystis_antarctica.AAC.1